MTRDKLLAALAFSLAILLTGLVEDNALNVSEAMAHEQRETFTAHDVGYMLAKCMEGRNRIVWHDQMDGWWYATVCETVKLEKGSH